MAKMKASPTTLLIGAIALGVLASMPREAWAVASGIGILGLVIWKIAKMVAEGRETKAMSGSPPKRTAASPSATPRTRPTTRLDRPETQVEDEGFVSFVQFEGPQTKEHRIPASPMDVGDKWRWIPAGQSISVAGFSITSGMLYFGSGLRSPYGEADPALINPNLKVSVEPVDVVLRLTDYWPSYSSITPEARRAYLQWLEDGRLDPEANIGYVFLFFYGLERRALVDARTDTTAKADISAIKAETHRLLGVYGENNAFRRYATHFLSYLAADQVPPKVYLTTPPIINERNYELPASLKLGLGQLAVDQQPVPANWALAWALADPNISRRTAVTRCEAEFAQLFRQKYAQVHGDGFILRNNKTKLRITYQPASAGLQSALFQHSAGDLPDVSAVKAPVQKLQALVDACTEALDPYSRFIGRNPDKAHALEGLLQLPVDLWPAPVKAELEDLKARVGEGIVVMSFGELSGRLKSAGPLSRDKVLGLARALQDLHLGMEPDVLSGIRIPKSDEKVALFATPPEDGDARVAPGYQAAAVTLDLACMVVLADGEASAHELLALTRHIDTWSHLSAAHRKRLKAHLRLGINQSATLAGLKKKLEPLSGEARRSIVRFLAHLAQTDGIVSPAEVKILERTYKALGLESKLVYTDLHSNEVPAPAATTLGSTPQIPQGFALDPARIAQLQKETEEVSALLANVFAEEVTQGHAEVGEAPPEEKPARKTTQILGLDADHSAFLRVLVSRSQWLRTELTDAAADMELMLDGALEHINETVFDAYDAPLTEGDDPVEINHEVLEALPI